MTSVSANIFAWAFLNSSLMISWGWFPRSKALLLIAIFHSQCLQCLRAGIEDSIYLFFLHEFLFRRHISTHPPFLSLFPCSPPCNAFEHPSARGGWCFPLSSAESSCQAAIWAVSCGRAGWAPGARLSGCGVPLPAFVSWALLRVSHCLRRAWLGSGAWFARTLRLWTYHLGIWVLRWDKSFSLPQDELCSEFFKYLSPDYGIIVYS